jgi:hypothetical protein
MPTEKPAAEKKSQYVRLNPWTSKRMARIEARRSSTFHEGSVSRKLSVWAAAKRSRKTAAILSPCGGDMAVG